MAEAITQLPLHIHLDLDIEIKPDQLDGLDITTATGLIVEGGAQLAATVLAGRTATVSALPTITGGLTVEHVAEAPDPTAGS